MSATIQTAAVNSEQNDLTALAQDYWRDGFVVLRGLFSAGEIATWSAECDRLLQQDWVDPKNVRTPFGFNSTITPERIDPILDVSPLFSQVTRDERLLAPLRAIWNSEPLPFKDKLIFKMPGVSGYTMHQDWAWGWQDLCAADDILSVSIQIDGADAANGCIELFAGYHHELLTPKGEQTNFRDREIALVDATQGQKMETKPGDILIFHSLTPHQSGKNNATYSRRSLYLTYNTAAAGDLREDYYRGYVERTGKGKFMR